MPPFNIFNDSINYIFNKFKIKNKKIDKKHYLMSYHMHPNRRLKKMFFMYPSKLTNGIEANMPFFTISVNKIKKNNKNKFVCIYNNFYEGEFKEIKINFTDKEDNISIKYNIKQQQKVIKIIKYAFDKLNKSLQKNINFYQQ